MDVIFLEKSVQNHHQKHCKPSRRISNPDFDAPPILGIVLWSVHLTAGRGGDGGTFYNRKVRDKRAECGFVRERTLDVLPNCRCEFGPFHPIDEGLTKVIVQKGVSKKYY